MTCGRLCVCVAQIVTIHTSLLMDGSLEAGFFCLDRLPELKVMPAFRGREGFADDQPAVLPSSPPADQQHLYILGLVKQDSIALDR